MARPGLLAAVFAVFGAAPAIAADRPVLTDADVSPIAWGTHDTDARGLAAQGRCADAAALVDAAGPGPRLVRAWLLSCAHAAPADLVAATEGLPDALPVGRPLVAALRAEALLTLNRAAEALPLVDTLDTPAGHRLRARALRETGATEPARAAYDLLIASRDPEDRALGLLGQARLLSDASGTGAEPPKAVAIGRALTLLRRLDVENPTHWAADTGRKLAATLLSAHPELRDTFEARMPEERLDRADRQLDAQRNDEAVADLAAWLGADKPAKAAKAAKPKKAEKAEKGPKLSPALACRARVTLGRGYKKLRQWGPAKATLTEAAALCHAAKSELEPSALYHLGATLDRLSFEDESADVYEALRKGFPGHKLADDAGFFLVRHALDDQKDWKAARALAEKLVKASPQGDMTAEAVFFVVAAAAAEDRWADARLVLGLYDHLPYPDPHDHDAGRTEYWRARIAQQLKAPQAEIVAGYRGVIASFPLGWYALMAYGRLHELDPAMARDAVHAAMASDLAQPSAPGGTGESLALEVPAALPAAAVDEALLYARLGLPGPASDALDRHASGLAPYGRSRAAFGGLVDLTDGDPSVDFFKAWLLDRAGDYHDSHDLMRRRLPFFRRLGADGPGRRWWQVAFPHPYAPLIEAAAKVTGVPAPFLWGIMREESGFNPGVESGANAIGLMQLIVPTAKRMAQKDEGPIDRETLKTPALNVTLGARYLGYVLGLVGGEKALPVLPAGYNAGEGALKRWLTARGHLPLDLFVELMPFEEARWYTKRVVSSYATYRYLYGGADAGDEPLPYFPLGLPR